MILWLLACAPPPAPLGPSRPVADDAMLAALAADSTFVAGLDVDDAVRGQLVPPDVLGPLGLVPEDLRQWRLGCGSAGCAALVEGDVSGVAWGAAHQLPGGHGARLHPVPDGLDVTDAAGERFALRVLAPDRAVAGDRRAVRELAHAAAARHAGEGPSFDATAIAGAVPAGQLWFAAHDPQRFAQQVADRLVRRDTPRARAALDTLARALADHPEAAERIEAVGAAVHVDERVTVAVRAVCADEATAKLAVRAARHALDHAPEDAAAWLERADEVVVAREGAITEVRATFRREVLE